MKIVETVVMITLLLISMFLLNITANADDAVLKVRVPADKLEMARKLVNKVPANENSIAAGKEIYNGKGTCHNCHGTSGKGDGPGGSSFNPPPRDFTDAKWQEVRTDGEIFWATTEGTEEGMIGFGDALLEEEKWQLVNYIRELGGIAE